jgi:hypothetical protein
MGDFFLSFLLHRPHTLIESQLLNDSIGKTHLEKHEARRKALFKSLFFNKCDVYI